MKAFLAHHEVKRAKRVNGMAKRTPLTNGHRESSSLSSGQRSASQAHLPASRNELDGTMKLNGLNDMDGTPKLNGTSHGTLGNWTSSSGTLTNGTFSNTPLNNVPKNGISPYDFDSQPSDDLTKKSWLQQVSKTCLAVDSPSRRSRRHQLEPYQETGAELTIIPQNIRKKLNFKSNYPVGNPDDERPRKRAKRDIIECQCHITVWDNREGTSATEALVKRSETCQLTIREGLAGSVVVDLEMSEPVKIPAKELEVLVKEKGRQALGIGDKYFLEIKIIPTKDKGEWPPVPVLSRSEGELYTATGKLSIEALQGALVARYMHLPQAPDSEIPLSVFFVHGGRAYKTKYGLEVNSTWGKPTVTLMHFKKELSEENFLPWMVDEGGTPFGRNLSNEKQASRRSSRKSLRPVESTVEVCYIFDPKSKETSKESRRATLKGFCCPACRIGAFDTLSQLRFHLINIHHKYKFELESEEHDPATDDLKSVTYNVSSVDPKKPREDLKSEWEWNWEAPQKPFDLDAYVKGDHSWVGVQTKKPRNPVPLVLSNDPVMALRQKSGGFLPAELVPELPEPKRKKYPVVQTNTRHKLPLYSSVSHRQLRLSEEPMSETDDEIDGGFITEKHLKTVEEMEGLSWGRKEFRMRWDAWRLEEGGAGGSGSTHPKFLSDSLVRFVRGNKGWLSGAGEEVWGEFCRFLNVLRERRGVDEKTLVGVFEMIRDAGVKGAGERIVNGDGADDVEMADLGPAEEQQPATKEALAERMEKLLSLPHGCCGICTNEIRSITRDMVQCSHEDCEVSGVMYHKTCVGHWQRERDPNWVCGLCKESVAERRRREKGKARALN